MSVAYLLLSGSKVRTTTICFVLPEEQWGMDIVPIYYPTLKEFELQTSSLNVKVSSVCMT